MNQTARKTACRNWPRMFVAIAAMLTATAAAHADTVTFQQGLNSYTGTDDTQMIEWGPNNNYGGRENFDVGTLFFSSTKQRAHSLVRFDLTSLAGQIDTVSSVTLRLHVTGQTIPDAGTVALYLLADANAGWVEGTFLGAGVGNPGDGLSTWNQRLSGTPGTNWAGSAGASTAGTDYINTVVASKAYTTNQASINSGVFDLVFTGDLSFLKTWADGGTNAGFFLKDLTEASTSNRINFYSSESVTASLRPELIINYVAVVPTPAALPAGLGLLTLTALRRKRRA